MDGEARRREIMSCLKSAENPVSAASLASRFSVSRQIIVGDIALLRAGGENIAATPRGYVLPWEGGDVKRTVACVHDRAGMARELEILVDHGCQVLDVIVEHPMYGQLTGQLHLSSRYDVQAFIRCMDADGARPLSQLTGGIHLHTISCASEERMERAVAALAQAGILLEDK